MAVTTWTFTSGFEFWDFTEDNANGGDALRSHVSGAIRVNLDIPGVTFADARGINTRSGLNTSITNGDTIAVDYGASSDAVIVGITITATYTDETTETTSTTDANGGTLTLTLTQAKTLDSIAIQFGIGTGPGTTPRNTDIDLEEVRLTTAVLFVGTGERPLELDIDLAAGSKIWASKWKDGGLYIQEYSSPLVLQSNIAIATGTTTSVIDLDTRTFYVSPYAPPFFGTASLDDIIYIFGRWDDSGIEHLKKSVDGGASFGDIGDSGTWGAGWVGAFFADDANTLFAFVNGSSRALYRSINAGSSWTNLSSLPFDVDPGGVSKHPDGRILIINRDTGAQMATYAEAPDYSSWIDATGSPSFPTGGGGSNSVIWIT